MGEKTSISMQDKVVLVTGGASGIGEACCERFAAAGAQVICADLQVGKGETVVARVEAAGGKIAFFEQDVTDEARWKELADQIMQQFGGLHALINNAGIGEGASILETTLEDFRRQFSINMEGVFLGTRTCIPLIDQSGGGAIVNLSSVAGLRGAPGLSTYCATKGAVRLYSKATALECARDGLKVRCNSVHPGIIETPIWESVINDDEQTETLRMTVQMRAQAAGIELPEGGGNLSVPRMLAAITVPGGEVGLPANVADGIVFLASDAAAYINGTELVIDSALTAGTL